MDLRKLNPAQLQQLIDRATRRREQITTRRLDKVRARIDAILKAEGLTLAEVYGAAAAGTTGRRGRGGPGRGTTARAGKRGPSLPPKYRNPDDPTQTWAGRGLKPRWLVAALAAGRTLDDLLIR